jgi:hypothetical protein
MEALTIFKKHERLKTFLNWGNSGQDYECLYYGMQKAGRLDLLPPRPKGPERPLSWWCTLRKRLNVGVSVLPLRLGHLHRMIYPEQTGLFRRWHNTGVDVIMTIRLINVYFCKLRNSPIPGWKTISLPSQQNQVPNAKEAGMRCKMNLCRALKLRTTKHCAYLERKRRWKQKPIALTMRSRFGF